jgi:hypothetical protein
MEDEYRYNNLLHDYLYQLSDRFHAVKSRVPVPVDSTCVDRFSN